MNRRKRIGLFTAYPETTHARRILEGVMCQCERYNYDLFVFASSVHLSFPHDRYVQGEANIYQLANFDELDGIILDSVSLIGDPENRTLKKLASRLARCEKLPVCTLEYPVEGIPLIPNNNEESIREQCRHAIEVHGSTVWKFCRNILSMVISITSAVMRLQKKLQGTRYPARMPSSAQAIIWRWAWSIGWIVWGSAFRKMCLSSALIPRMKGPLI